MVGGSAGTVENRCGMPPSCIVGESDDPVLHRVETVHIGLAGPCPRCGTLAVSCDNTLHSHNDKKGYDWQSAVCSHRLQKYMYVRSHKLTIKWKLILPECCFLPRVISLRRHENSDSHWFFDTILGPKHTPYSSTSIPAQQGCKQLIDWNHWERERRWFTTIMCCGTKCFILLAQDYEHVKAFFFLINYWSEEKGKDKTWDMWLHLQKNILVQPKRLRCVNQLPEYLWLKHKGRGAETLRAITEINIIFLR